MSDVAPILSLSRLRSAAAERWPELSAAELDASVSDDWVLVALLQNRFGLNRRDAVAEVVALQAAIRS